MTDTKPPETKPSETEAEGKDASQYKDKVVEQVEFVRVHDLDPRRSLPRTSQYLDEVEREKAEIVRAKLEDRKPDLKNPPATQGTPYRQTKAIEAELPVHVEVKGDVTLPVVTGLKEKK